VILVALIVVPCAVVGIGAVTLFDRAGVFSALAAGGGPTRGVRPAGPAYRLPRVVMLGLLVVMGGWVLAWIVLLLVGLGILSG